jgi:hypothetical protein
MSQRKPRAEIQRNYRLNHGTEYGNKESDRMKLKRASISEEEKEEVRRKSREYMRKKRQHTEQDNITEQVTLFTPQTLGKAIVKAEKALPLEVGRRITVLQELCKRENLTVIHRQPLKFAGTYPREELHEKVKFFFTRDDISRQAPGLKDTCYVSELKQKVWFMITNLFYAYF